MDARPYPTTCRVCGGQLDRIAEEPLCYDVYTANPRTFKYTYACRKNIHHPKLIVLENPTSNFRAVIPEEKFDPDIAKGLKKRQQD